MIAELFCPFVRTVFLQPSFFIRSVCLMLLDFLDAKNIIFTWLLVTMLCELFLFIESRAISHMINVD